MADDPCLAASWSVAEAAPANHYYRARYYDPKAGRFISEDPIGVAGGLHRFAYVHANSVRWIDPTGLTATCYFINGNLTCTDDSTGKFIVNERGYSGAAIVRDDPWFQGFKNLGPIPPGEYTIGAPNTRRGPVTLPLTPDPTNPIKYRDGFLIHGDNTVRDASIGCIIVSRPSRDAIAAAGGGKVIVPAQPTTRPATWP